MLQTLFQPRSARFRRRVFALLAFVLGFALAVAVLEVGLRVARKKAFFAFSSDNVDHVVLCVGDSNTEGLEAPANLDYPTQLQIMLNRHDTARVYNVVNLGQAGNNSSQVVNRTLAYLAEAPRAPDVVIFNAGINNKDNLAEASFLPEKVRGQSARTQLKYLLANSRTFHLTTLSVARIKAAMASNAKKGAGGPLPNDVLKPTTDAEATFLVAWMIDDLTRLHSALAARDASLVLLTYHFDCTWQAAAYRAVAHKLDVQVIDVHNFLAGRQIGKFVAPGMHPNEFGYARIAELTRDALIDRRLLPPPERPL